MLAAHGRFYTALAEGGIAVVDAEGGAPRVTVPPLDSGSIDDLAIDGDLLFALDARPPGAVSVYSLSDPAHPRLVSDPRPVAVGPFSGVSAAGGLCIVSGGTSQLSAWTYDSTGALVGPVAMADYGRGQPDVVVAPGGRQAFVSTHFWGPKFGLTRVRFDAARRELTAAGSVPLDGAGFTAGGARPANFPIEAATMGADTVLVAHARGLAVFVAQGDSGLARGPLVDVGGPAVNVDAMGNVAAVAAGGDAPAVVLVQFRDGAAEVTRRIALPAGTKPAGVALTATSVAVAARAHGVLVFGR